jgi:DNA polymerase (family 10)
MDKIPSVGKSIARKIAELIETGELKYYKKLKASFPVKVEELMSVQGMGPKTIKILYKKLKIKSLSELKKSAKQGKIKKIKGLSQTVEKNILEGMKTVKTAEGRMLLWHAIPLAEEIKQKISSLKGVKKVEIAGSFRRKKETIGDFDILVISDKPTAVISSFCSMPEVNSVATMGAMKSSVRLKNGLSADLYVLKEKEFGSALHYFTGSKEHSIELRKIALKKGYTLSEHGLFSVRTKKWEAGRTEEEIYKKLKMQFVPPELRENMGEIEAALKNKIPKLVEHNDFKGDFHMHTKWTDGDNTIKDMAIEAQGLGFKFITITDHAGPLKMVNALDERKIKKYVQEIDKAQKKVGIKIFKGAEIDINKEGCLTLKKSALKELDVVIAAVHSSFKIPKKEMTKRLCHVMENYPVNILAHPTGRIIGKRLGYDLNMEKLFKTAKETNTFLDVDTFPNRQDLNSINIKAALKAGCKISLSSDAHNKNQIHFSRTLGIPLARRGWAGPKDILNCWSIEKIKKALRK